MINVETRKKDKKTIWVNENIKLKEIDQSDAEDIFRIINSQRKYLGAWLPFVAITKEVGDTEKYIQSILDTPEEKREYIFVIYFNSESVGLIGSKGTDKLNKKTEIGYWLSENFQKKGIMTESVRSVIKFIYDELGLNRIQIKCAVGNIPSKSIPKRLNFKFEGIERDGELLTGNRFTDLKVYSKLKNDRQ